MKTHGLSGTPEYQIWQQLRGRCLNPKNKGYRYYGGRGITVDPRWDMFVNFLADMGPRPSKKHSVERKDNDGNYTPSNCIWMLTKNQNKNRRRGTHLCTKCGAVKRCPVCG